MKGNRPVKTNRLRVMFLWAFFFYCLSILNPAPASTADHSTLQNKIQHGGYAFEVDGKPGAEFEGDRTFIPASTIKILTDLAALKLLGTHYRFPTHFYLDDNSNLYIQGEGDPFLVSENISAIAEQLHKKGLRRINELILDTSRFHLESRVDGSNNTSNPFDAENGALCVNFNTLAIRVSDTGNVASDEPQTPTLPIMKEIGKYLDQGHHRINVGAYPARTGMTNINRYTGELFIAFMKAAGVTTENNIKVGAVPAGAHHLHTYHSRQAVTDLVRMNLKYSNNFIANQLFLTFGGKRYGFPATWEKARKALAELIYEQTGLSDKEVHLIEGSGLSRKNRVTPRAMLKILHAFRPYAHLLPSRQGMLIKSGTLKGVYSYAGYFRHHNRLDPFVIFLNQENNTRDQLLDLLFKEYRILAQTQH